MRWMETNVGICSRRLANHEQENVKVRHSRMKVIERATGSTKNLVIVQSSEPGARVGLFIAGDQISYYNAITALN
jgi:hypothetical protein